MAKVNAISGFHTLDFLTFKFSSFNKDLIDFIVKDSGKQRIIKDKSGLKIDTSRKVNFNRLLTVSKPLVDTRL